VTRTGVMIETQISSLSGFALAVSGALQTQLAINAAGVASLNGLSGALNIVGTGMMTVSTGAGKIYVSGDNSISGALTQTGQILYGNIVAVSGSVASSGTSLYNMLIGSSGLANSSLMTLSGNAAQTGAQLQTAVANTGAALYTLITGASGQSLTNYATKVQLTQSGVDLAAQVSSLSGYTNQFLVHRTGAETISGAKTFVNNNQEAFIVRSGASNLLIVSGNATKMLLPNGTLILDSNQQVLFDSAANTSVDWSTKYLGDTNSVQSLDWQNRTLVDSVGTTVANWSNRTLSGPVGVVANWGTSTLTGEWQTNAAGTASGTIVNFSRLTSVSGALQALIAGGGSVVKISGSAAIATADFTGIGGTVVLYSDGKIFISGAAAGVGGGVPSVNGISSAVTIVGTGGLSVTSVGSNVYVSGFDAVSDSQILFNNAGTTSGTDDLHWDNANGTLEIGNPTLTLPDNPLYVGGSGTYLQLNIRNRSTANDASADLVLTTDVGSDTSGYLDLGINNSNYALNEYSMGASGDGYLYVNGGSLDIAVSSTGKLIQFYTSGTQAHNLRMTINNTGLHIPRSGFIQVGDEDRKLVIGANSITSNSGSMYFSGLASNPIAGMLVSGWGMTRYASALYDRNIQCILPSLTTSQFIFGGDTAANVGTLSTVQSDGIGRHTLYTPAIGLSAGTSFTTASVYRGTNAGLGNGFFFTSSFVLDSTWASGLAVGTYAAPSGSRIFVGVTDQAVATQTNLTHPVGNWVGLRYMWASGGSVGTGEYWQNWAVGSRNNSQAYTGHTAMAFQTGAYRFSMFCPKPPGSNMIYYQLDDLIRGSGVQGIITSNLPTATTAMRPLVALGFVSGIKRIGTKNLYFET